MDPDPGVPKTCGSGSQTLLEAKDSSELSLCVQMRGVPGRQGSGDVGGSQARGRGGVEPDPQGGREGHPRRAGQRWAQPLTRTRLE
jgi:hypothetical protein